jgi:putative ABC transport system ATP-binding protein
MLLRTEELSKTYWNGSESTVALDKLNLQVRKGEFLAVYGPSGSGKTTLLFLLGGLDRPTSGRIFLEGVEVSTLDERRLSRVRRNAVGFVFQHYNLVEELTALENITLTMMFEGKPPHEMKERAMELIGQVGLAGKERHRPSQLSAGEQQRVAVARALANRPKMVLMDEPTGNLDEENSRSLMQLVTNINRDEEVTCIVATHNLEIIRKSKSKILLRSGQLAVDPSPPSEVYDGS